MSADSYETDWHLTPTGWVEGSSRCYGVPSGPQTPPPPNRLLTGVLREFQSSAFSRPALSWWIAWCGTALREVAQAVLAHGEMPPGLSMGALFGVERTR